MTASAGADRLGPIRDRADRMNLDLRIVRNEPLNLDGR
jgi:hypothetical protein